MDPLINENRTLLILPLLATSRIMIEKLSRHMQPDIPYEDRLYHALYMLSLPYFFALVVLFALPTYHQACFMLLSWQAYSVLGLLIKQNRIYLLLLPTGLAAMCLYAFR